VGRKGGCFLPVLQGLRASASVRASSQSASLTEAPSHAVGMRSARGREESGGCWWWWWRVVVVLLLLVVVVWAVRRTYVVVVGARPYYVAHGAVFFGSHQRMWLSAKAPRGGYNAPHRALCQGA